MSLATTCPNCSTCFRVVQDQLRVSEGWVRCGNCQQVFNALESLFDLDAPHEPVGLPAVQTPLPAQPHRGVWQTEATAQWMRRRDRSMLADSTPEAHPIPSHPSEREEPLSDDLRAALHAEPITHEHTPEAPDSSPMDEPAFPAQHHDEQLATPELAPPEHDEPGETAFAPYSVIENRTEPRFEPTEYLAAELSPEAHPSPVAAPVAEAAAFESARSTEPLLGSPMTGPLSGETDAIDQVPTVDAGSPEPPAMEARETERVIEDAPKRALFEVPEQNSDEAAAPTEGLITSPPDDQASTASPDDGSPVAPGGSGDAFTGQVDEGTDAAFGTFADDTAALTAPPTDGDPKATSDLPDFVLAADRRARWQSTGARLTLSAVGVLLALSLVAQTAWHWRNLLAVTWEPAQAPLQHLCAWAGCQLEAPRKLDAWVVDNTTVTRPPGVTGYRLNVHLHNRAPHAVAAPSFDLVLTDAQGATISRRVLHPTDFGFQAADLAGHAEAQWSMEFMLAEGSLVGYTLAAFYP